MAIGTAESHAVAEAIAERVEARLRGRRSETRSLEIARAAIEITVEEELAELVLPPFQHLVNERRHEPALRIAVAAMSAEDAASMDLNDLPDSGVVTSSGSTIVYVHRGAAVVFDRGARTIAALVRSDSEHPSWRRAKPLQLPLSIFFADRGVDLLHGGLVSLRGNGALVAGAGGSGKSTVVLASLLDGLDFLGDDCVGVGNAFEGYSVFGSSCLERAHLRHFAFAADAGADSKAVLPIAQSFRERMVASTTIRAIVLPRVTGGERVTLRPASGKEALLALAPSSILKRAVPAAVALSRMTRMARELPSYRLEMGPVAAIGPRIRELLEELAG